MTPNNDYSLELAAVLAILFFIAALPLKNWLEIKTAKKERQKWDGWLNSKPNLETYCKEHQQDPKNPSCDYCGSSKQLPRIDKSIPYEPIFGFVDNRHGQLFAKQTDGVAIGVLDKNLHLVLHILE